MNVKFFQANELSDLGMESDFCLSLVDDHCDTQKSISSFVLSTLIMLNDLSVFGIATRIPSSLTLNRY